MWEAKPAYIASGRGCPRCFRIRQGNRQRKPWQEVTDYCTKNNIEIVSKAEEYRDRKSILKFRCMIDKSHDWKSTINSIMGEHGCPQCAHRSYAYTIENIDEIAKKRGWECLTRKYENQNTPLMMRCPKGHTWKTKGIYIMNSDCGCPECSRRKGEKRCTIIFQMLFGAPFEKKHPVWLNGLELDGYNETLKIAFEYNGQQHYAPHKFFHQKRTFEEQQQIDETKKQVCKNNDVILLSIPAAETVGGIYTNIIAAMKQMNVTIPVFDDKKLEEVDGIAGN